MKDKDLEIISEVPSFEEWLNTFLSEKGISQEEILEFKSDGVNQYMPIAVVVEFMVNSGKENQRKVKDQLMKIDFHNASVRDFLLHIAKFISTL